MTDRHAGYIVTLDHDIREDDAETIINAIRALKFVATVEPVVSDFRLQMARNDRDAAWVSALGTLARTGPGQ